MLFIGDKEFSAKVNEKIKLLDGFTIISGDSYVDDTHITM